MSKEEDIVAMIEGSRKVSEDGTLVTYDLTSNVDFSNPKIAAEALAKVFFEKDAVNWFKISNDHVEFDPKFKIRIVLAEEHNKKLEETVDDFLGDVKKREIYPEFSKQIDDAAERATKLKASMIGHAISSALFKHSDRKIYDNYFQDDLFLDILEKLEIRSLDNKDLLDWKNLPI